MKKNQILKAAIVCMAFAILFGWLLFAELAGAQITGYIQPDGLGGWSTPSTNYRRDGRGGWYTSPGYGKHNSKWSHLPGNVWYTGPPVAGPGSQMDAIAGQIIADDLTWGRISKRRAKVLMNRAWNKTNNAWIQRQRENERFLDAPYIKGEE